MVEIYDVNIRDKNFKIKKFISAREENLCGIKQHMMKFNNTSKDEISNLIFDTTFEDCNIKLLSYMIDYPKMTPDQLLDLDSDVLMTLKLEAIMNYEKSFESMKEFMEKKKTMIQNSSAMESSCSSEMKPQNLLSDSDLRKRLNQQQKS
jgi:hypothetical protein